MDPLAWVGKKLAHFLEQPASDAHAHIASDLLAVGASLQTGDVLLVEGNRRFSVAIKYLTHSAWSHAALYVGKDGANRDDIEAHRLIDADTSEGVREVGLGVFDGLPVRICRPRNLSEDERARVVTYAVQQIGHQYDMRNVFDLARYLIPTPPVPSRLRRRLIAFGSGDPTRAICSTLVASAFQSIRFPILPIIERRARGDPACPLCVDELWHIRHHSLFVPADFDHSPFFDVVKPEWRAGFDHRSVTWTAAEIGSHIANA